MNTDKIVSLIRHAVKGCGEFVPLHAPAFEGNDSRYVQDCIASGWVSSVGQYVDRFEESLAAYAGVRRAVACVNGTAALHACLHLVGVDRDSEVIMPALTFVATANAATYCGAFPHFVDVEEETLGLDPEATDRYLESIADFDGEVCRNRLTGRRIAAIVPMHAFGFPVRLGELVAVSVRWGVPIVEDAAESLGSHYRGRHTGGFGRCAAVSFNGNKIITSGGGGAILTDDLVLADRAKHITTTAKLPHRWEFWHDEVGFNYRMPNINAALALAQLEQIGAKLERKRRLASSYAALFQGIDGVRFVSEPAGTRSNYWLNTLLLSDSTGRDLSELLEALNGAGIMARPCWTPLHFLDPFKDCPRGPLEVTERLSRQLMNIPSSDHLGRSL